MIEIKPIRPHRGRRTSRRAAYDFGLDFVGYEIDKVYFDLQEEAFEAYTAQIRIEI